MCKRDEGFSEEEIIEETGWCKDCKMDCKYAGHELRDVYPDYPYGERKFRYFAKWSDCGSKHQR